MKETFLFLLCLCVGVLPSFAQDDNLTVTGRVVDEAGAKFYKFANDKDKDTLSFSLLTHI